MFRHVETLQCPRLVVGHECEWIRNYSSHLFKTFNIINKNLYKILFQLFPYQMFVI